MTYHYLTYTIGGFIQQAAVCYVQRGYWFYVAGQVTSGKSLFRADRKILDKYDIALSKYQRYRRKLDGQAGIQYLRYKNNFLLLATDGLHPFFDEENSFICDVRLSPIRMFGHTIAYKNGHVLVSLDEETYRHLKADFIELALHQTSESLMWKFKTLPFEPYKPTLRQIFNIWKAVNIKRKTAGLPLLPFCLRNKRKLYRPFERPSSLSSFS